jgi:hypothetical protein
MGSLGDRLAAIFMLGDRVHIFDQRTRLDFPHPTTPCSSVEMVLHRCCRGREWSIAPGAPGVRGVHGLLSAGAGHVCRVGVSRRDSSEIQTILLLLGWQARVRAYRLFDTKFSAPNRL